MAGKNLSSFSSRSLTRKDMRLDFKSFKSFLLCQVSFNLQVLMPHSIKKNHSSLADKKTAAFLFNKHISLDASLHQNGSSNTAFSPVVFSPH